MNYKKRMVILALACAPLCGVLATNDTVTVEKIDEMHFESVDCNPSFFHTISRVTHTKHVIDSIVIQNPKVDYDSQREHFRIYFRTLD